jgi:pimeloyl-ACP methyl ester carboxylesterase
MSKVTRLGCLAGVGLFLILAFGPFLVPVPPLENTVSPSSLADPDSRFLEVEGLTVHYKRTGQGEPLYILLHGFLGSTFSWREILEPLGAYGTVVAFDRPGFGLTERPRLADWSGDNPYSPEAQIKIIHALMDEFGSGTAILVGNSAGGALAAYTAAQNPARVEKLVLVDAAVFSGGGTPVWLRPVLQLPQVDRLGPLVSRSVEFWGEGALQSAWADQTLLTDDIVAGANLYRSVEDWDLALWEFTKASRPLGLESSLRELPVETLVITGAEDQIVPPAESVQLAETIPGAAFGSLPGCGHVPQEECPDQFLNALTSFLSGPGR